MDKELAGTKTMIKIQAQRLVKIKPTSLANLPKQWIKMSDGYSKKFTHTIWVKVSDVSNKERLAWVVRKHFGFGKFNILFYNRLSKSSNFNPNFRCLFQRNKDCKYKEQNRCTIFNRHRKGWACKVNRRFRPNWNARARITIVPNDLFSDVDFRYIWERGQDKMHYFRKWFWRDVR
jgi:hypothetical protein